MTDISIYTNTIPTLLDCAETIIDRGEDIVKKGKPTIMSLKETLLSLTRKEKIELQSNIDRNTEETIKEDMIRPIQESDVFKILMMSTDLVYSIIVKKAKEMFEKIFNSKVFIVPRRIFNGVIKEREIHDTENKNEERDIS